MSLISDLIVTLKRLKSKSEQYENPGTWSGEVSGGTLLEECPNDAFITVQLLQRFLYFLDAEGIKN